MTTTPRPKVTETVLKEEGTTTWTLDEFKALIEDAVKKIPLPYHPSAAVPSTVSVELSTDASCDDDYPVMRITYERPMNDAEFEAHTKQQARYAEVRRAAERREYERLHAIFGKKDPPPEKGSHQ